MRSFEILAEVADSRRRPALGDALLTDRFDAIVIGSGSGGRGVAKRLAAAGMSVAMVESELVGGECPFWACMPAKTLLRPPEAVASANRVPGVAARIDSWDEVVAFRDEVTDGFDDGAKAERYRGLGVTILRGHGRLAGAGVVEVDGTPHLTERVVIATGSETAPLPIDGLDTIDVWTNREVLAITEVPESIALLGGGPVGVELGQMLARYGSRVHIIETAERLLAKEEPRVGTTIAAALTAEGIDVRAGCDASRASRRRARACWCDSPTATSWTSPGSPWWRAAGPGSRASAWRRWASRPARRASRWTSAAARRRGSGRSAT